MTKRNFGPETKKLNVEEIHRLILDFFHAHAIKGNLKPTRTYEVIERDGAHLKIRTRDKNGRSVQTLFADLMTCKSFKYGEFRRVDLFWGVERRNEENVRPSGSKSCVASDEPAITSLPQSEFYPNGELVPVDAFMDRGLDGRLSGRIRKEKAS